MVIIANEFTEVNQAFYLYYISQERQFLKNIKFAMYHLKIELIVGLCTKISALPTLVAGIQAR